MGEVLLHNTLSCLLYDDGLPLGLATSGFSFVRISYFWSANLWGGLLGLRQLRTAKTLHILSSIVLAGLLALTAGPASAILMLPRETVSAHNMIGKGHGLRLARHGSILLQHSG